MSKLFLTQEVIERSQLSGEFFTAFLHQNYPEFYMSVDDLVSASEYLSDADYLTTDWVVGHLNHLIIDWVEGHVKLPYYRLGGRSC